MTVNGPKERRWRIIHSQVIRNAAVAQRYKKLGLIAEVQPYHAIDDMRWMEERIGDRAKWAYAFKTFKDAGVPLLFGSDWPGTNASWYTANPMTILYAAVTRQTLDGKPAGGWFPEQRLDLETSLRSYTVNNAWAEGEEASKGSLVGGQARGPGGDRPRPVRDPAGAAQGREGAADDGGRARGLRGGAVQRVGSSRQGR